MLCILSVFCLLFVVFVLGLAAVPHFASAQTSLGTQSGSVTDRSENAKIVDIRSNDAVRIPEVSFLETSSSVDEESHSHSVRVSITVTINPPTERFELEYRISESSTATQGGDYVVPISHTLQVFPGDRSVEISLTVIADWYAEEDETIILILQPANPGNPKYILGNNSVHTLTIESGDPTIISEVDFFRKNVMVSELPAAPSYTLIQVYLSNGMYLGDDGNLYPAPDIPGIINDSVAPEKGLTLNYEVGGTATPGEDYIITETNIQVPGNESFTALGVEILDDNVSDTDETIILTLTDGDGYNVGKENPSITINIVETTMDVGVIFLPEMVFASTLSSASEDAGTHNVAVNINPVPQAGLTLNYRLGGTADEGADYSITGSGTVAVPARASSVNIPVVITDDSYFELDETVILTLTSGTGYDVGNTDIHTLTITDNDRPPEMVFALTSSSASEDAGTHNVTVNINPVPQAGLTLNYRLGGTAVQGADYSITGSGTVAVPVGASSVNIPVVITDDGDVESDETVILTLTSGTGYDVGNIDTHTLTIRTMIGHRRWSLL